MVAEDKQPLDAASEAREDGFAAFFLLRERTMQTHLALSALLLAGFVPAADPDPELEHALGVLKTRSISPDGPELLRFFRERTLTDADRARLADAVRRLADEDFSVREKATAELMRAGRQALTYLREAANDPDLERSRGPAIASRSPRAASRSKRPWRQPACWRNAGPRARLGSCSPISPRPRTKSWKSGCCVYLPRPASRMAGRNVCWSGR